MNYIWDGVLILAIVICIGFSVNRGFIKASKSILAIILTAVLLSSLQPLVFQMVQGTAISEKVRGAVSDNISQAYKKKQLPEDTDTTDKDNTEIILDTLAFPSFMKSSIQSTISGMTEIKNNVMEVVTDSVTYMILSFISIVLVFLLVRVFVFLILKLLEGLFELPGLNTINRVLGGVIGVINSLLIVYIVCGAVSLFTPVDKLAIVEETVNNTYILKYFYENNLLMSFFV